MRHERGRHLVGLICDDFMGRTGSELAVGPDWAGELFGGPPRSPGTRRRSGNLGSFWGVRVTGRFPTIREVLGGVFYFAWQKGAGRQELIGRVWGDCSLVSCLGCEREGLANKFNIPFYSVLKGGGLRVYQVY